MWVYGGAPFELVVTTSCYFVGFAFEGLMQAKKRAKSWNPYILKSCGIQCI
jgi:hypothetical protein